MKAARRRFASIRAIPARSKLLVYRLSYLSSGPGRTAELARLDALVHKALSFERNDLRARWAKGVLDVMHGRNDEAIVEFLARGSLRIAATSVVYGWLGWIYMTTGRKKRRSLFSTKPCC